MTIRLFPPLASPLPAGFGLRREAGTLLELPQQIILDADAVHIVHSDPAQPAILCALVGLQCWTLGLDPAGPPAQRRPVLLVTERPAAITAAYLELRLAREALRPLARHRRLSFYERGLPVPDKRGTLWDTVVDQSGEDLRLHNLFPAAQLLRLGCEPRLVGPREYLGRGDEEGPAILLVRPFELADLREICAVQRPVLALVDLQGVARPPELRGVPTLVFHDSVFSSGLLRVSASGGPVLLPDSALESFARGSQFCIVEPSVSETVSRAWERLDGALQLLLERTNERHHSVLRETLRVALRLREILLQLPLGLASYEQCLVLSGLHESLWDGWSATRLLQSLGNRRAEMGALGEWEEMLFAELVDSFHEISGMLQNHAPKTEAVLMALDDGSRAVLVSTSRVVAGALNAACGFPQPLGLGLIGKPVRAVSQMRFPRCSPVSIASCTTLLSHRGCSAVSFGRVPVRQLSSCSATSCAFSPVA